MSNERMGGLPSDYDHRAKVMDMRKIMFHASAELGDGESQCTYETVEQLCEAIKEFARNYTSPSDSGESFTVELVALTPTEFNELPEL